jgi:hypothetical protein
VVEGTPLLRVQVRKGLEGSNPFLSATDLCEPQRLHAPKFHCFDTERRDEMAYAQAFTRPQQKPLWALNRSMGFVRHQPAL